MSDAPFYTTTAMFAPCEWYDEKPHVALGTATRDDKQLKLERNRIAASKCRQRKKMWVEDLTRRSDHVVQRNTALKQMVAQLKDEVLHLRNQLLTHRGCNCHVIKNYIQLHMLDQIHQTLPSATSSLQSFAFHHDDASPSTTVMAATPATATAVPISSTDTPALRQHVSQI